MPIRSVLFLLVSLTAAAPGQTVLTADPRKGPPGDQVITRGSGFHVSELIDVYFDKSDLALARTDSSGGFRSPLPVPRSAVPGRHTISAVGRQSRLTAQAPFLVQTDWRELQQGTERQGYNRKENVLNAGNVGMLRRVWSANKVSDLAPPVVADGVLYSASAGVYALDAATGRPIWTAPASPNNSTPAVSEGVVYVVTQNPGHSIYAYDAANGKLKWSAATENNDANLTAPVVWKGVVYVAEQSFDGCGGNSYLGAYNALTGRLIWNAPIGGYSAPAVADGIVYVDHLAAFSAATGKQLWGKIYPCGGPGLLPVVAGGIVYLRDEALFAFDARTGQDLWMLSDAVSAPAVAEGVLYLPGVGSMNALNAATGKVIWRTTAGVLFTTPVVANGLVYAAAGDNNIYAFDTRTGKQLWSAALSGESAGMVPSSPVVVNGMVYVATPQGSIDAFGLPAGEK